MKRKTMWVAGLIVAMGLGVLAGAQIQTRPGEESTGAQNDPLVAAAPEQQEPARTAIPADTQNLQTGFQPGAGVQQQVLAGNVAHLPQTEAQTTGNQAQPSPERPWTVRSPLSASRRSLRISGPITHNNLSLYLLQAADTPAQRNALTLEEAIERKLLVVHETGNVGTLTVENRSPGFSVFIQAGEIVKGGRQDRVLGVDLLVPPSSGKVPIQSFCVEHGRWTQREGEPAAQFNSSKNYLPHKDLRLAAKHGKNQQQIWESVRNTQEKLAANTGADVRSPKSESSLELTLENPEVERSAEEYEKALLTCVEGEASVVGVAIAVNGRLNSADVYESPDLFRKMWPKLLRAAAVEALAEWKEGGVPDPPSVAAVRQWIESGGAGRVTEQQDRGSVVSQTRETDGGVLFETWDKSNSGVYLHLNYLAK